MGVVLGRRGFWVFKEGGSLCFSSGDQFLYVEYVFRDLCSGSRTPRRQDGWELMAGESVDPGQQWYAGNDDSKRDAQRSCVRSRLDLSHANPVPSGT